MTPRCVGLVANPASGKDVRRVTARASVFDNQEKSAMVRRCLVGIRAFSSAPIRYMPDPHHVARRAVDELKMDAQALDIEIDANVGDTVRAARALRGAAAVIVLGGDGTNRAFAKGWLDAPLIALSTGTNNAFPTMQEATTAGAAAGVLATGDLPLAGVAHQAKAIHIDIDGENSDLALIDAVFTRDRFVGARALDDPSRIKAALLTRADPAGVGMTSVGGFARPMSAAEDTALSLEFDASGPNGVYAALAPGRFERIGISELRVVGFEDAIRWTGPGVLAFDGERERTLKPGQTATLRAVRDGPWVVDVAKVLGFAVCRRGFVSN